MQAVSWCCCSSIDFFYFLFLDVVVPGLQPYRLLCMKHIQTHGTSGRSACFSFNSIIWCSAMFAVCNRWRVPRRKESEEDFRSTLTVSYRGWVALQVYANVKPQTSSPSSLLIRQLDRNICLSIILMTLQSPEESSVMQANYNVNSTPPPIQK